MTKLDTNTLFQAIGNAEFQDVVIRFFAEHEDAVDLIMTELVSGNPFPENGYTRAHHEDLEELLMRAAWHDSDRFIKYVEEHPELRKRLVVLSAIASVRHPKTLTWLLETLKSPSGHNRWVALRALIHRQALEVRPLLRKLLKDRDSLVGFEAVSGLRRWGVIDDIDALMTYAKTADLGAKWLAEDAVESICERSGHELPAGHPGRRLLRVEIPSGSEIQIEATAPRHLSPGELLATVDGVRLDAPREVVVVAIDEEADGSAHFVLRCLS